MKTLPSVDVVIVGGGWTGMLMAKEVGARSSASVVLLERGGPRNTRAYSADMDELDYYVRLHMMQDPSQETVTLRRNANERALPIRQFQAFLPGTGVGGTGEHWGAQCPRFMPDCFELYSKTVEKYGEKKLPEDHTIQDWGVTYDEMEPYYLRAERMLGVSGKAGNLNGKKIEGGNVFEGWRSAEYPNPPIKLPYFGSLFGAAAKSMGYHPYPAPTAILSQNYTNPDGVTRSACAFCGFCEHTGCMIAAKSQPTNTLLPLILKQKTVSIRTGAHVRRIVHDTAENGGNARGVNYISDAGEEFFQPADVVILASWTLSNNRLLLFSGLGNPYDPATGKGTLGKNLTHQVNFNVQAFLEKPMNRFMGAGGAGLRIADFDGDVLDHSNLPFLRGGNFGAINSGTQPITGFGVLPRTIKSRWGSEWKKASMDYFDRTGSIAFSGEHLPYKTNYVDLDPTYKDQAGDPLLRLTLNWRDNEKKMAEFMTAKAVEIAHAMGAKEINPFRGYGDYDVTRYQTTHVQGGTMIGTSPERAVLNTYLQHWQARNVFVLGGSTFPNTGSANPTPTILALTYRAADALIDRYLKKPSLLA
jgi:gluconate 2-dehydrogenase alpha chain